MNPKSIALAVVAALALAAGGYGVYLLGMESGMKMSGVPAPAPAAGRRILYWHDPMVPGQKFDKPGKSPFMDMQLVPVYADEGGGDASVRIDPGVQQNLGVRTEEVTQGSVAPRIEAVGSVAYNERDVAVVQARGNGYVERLYVRAPLDPVRKGQPLAELYVPDWVAAQEEYLAAKRMGASAPAAPRRRGGGACGSRECRRSRSFSSSRRGKAHPRLTVRAPRSATSSRS